MRAYLLMDPLVPSSFYNSFSYSRTQDNLKFPNLNLLTGVSYVSIYCFSPNLPFIALLCDPGQARRDNSLLQAALSGKCAGVYKKEVLSLTLGLWAFLLLCPAGSFLASCVQKTPRLHLLGIPFHSSLAGGSVLPSNPFRDTLASASTICKSGFWPWGKRPFPSLHS